LPLHDIIKETKTDCPASFIVLTPAEKCYNMSREGPIAINNVMSEKDLKIIIKKSHKAKK